MSAAPPGPTPRIGWTWPALVLFFLMLFLPTSLRPVKAVLLAAVLFLVVAGALHRPCRTLHRSVALWGGVVVVTGLGFMVRGLWRGEPGALRVGTVWALWPALFLVAIAGLERAVALLGFLRLLVLGTLAVALHGLAFVLEATGVLPVGLLPGIDPTQVIGLHDGFVELGMASIATLVFTMPFLVAALFAWRRPSGDVVPRGWIWAALLLGLLLVALSGRRALLMVTAVSPILTGAFLWFLPRDERSVIRRTVAGVLLGLGSVAAVAAVVLGDVYELRPAAMWEMFSQGFDPRVSEAMSIRVLQLRELLAAWADHPWLGAGHGSFLRSHIRDIDVPWAYELSYATLLFQTGVVGSSLYGILLGWLYWQGLRIVRRGGDAGRTIVPLLVGMTTFLIANATNPYLVKFDFMWILFLPLAMINRWLIDQDQAGVAPPVG